MNVVKQIGQNDTVEWISGSTNEAAALTGMEKRRFYDGRRDLTGSITG